MTRSNQLSAQESFAVFFAENPMKPIIRERLERLNPEGIWPGRTIRGLDWKPMSWRRAKKQILKFAVTGRIKCLRSFRMPGGKQIEIPLLYGPSSIRDVAKSEMGIEI